MRLYGPDIDGSRRRMRTMIALAATLAVLACLAVGPTAAGAATTHDPYGHIDSMTWRNGTINIAGWTIDPDSAQSLTVRVSMDGVAATSSVANIARLDVAKVYPAAGSAHGFWIRLTAPNGSHRMCVTAVNVGLGGSTTFPCQSVYVSNNPDGQLHSLALAPGGVRAEGWAVDPNTHSAVAVRMYSDGQLVRTQTANLTRNDIGAAYSQYGAAHGFDMTVALAVGAHRVCLVVVNTGLGGNTALPCATITVTHDPLGSISSFKRSDTSPTTAAYLSGWALDPDTADPIPVSSTVDGVPTAAAGGLANVGDAWISQRFPNYGALHKYSITFPINANEHTVCVTARNQGLLGLSKSLGCRLIASTGDTTPAPVPNFQAWPGNTTVDLTWTAPRSVNAAITSYRITANPGAVVVTVNGSTFTAHFSKLTNGTTYTFSIAAVNSFGTGTSATQSTSPANIPPQFSPAPVSTSHYPRNWTGNATTDAALLRNMGATDASYNPSGHRYLVLQDVGGQDQIRGGVLLSATSKYFSYAYLVTMMKAYMDGYHSAQKPYAPLVLAIGTNNDVDVSATAGAQWANSVVDPLAAYAGRYPGITVAGANDIEPGFSASVADSKSWVSGYLANTSAQYVFNGSADGCSTTTAGTRCNNGWTMADLHWVGGGVSPARSIALPQVYNSAMSVQWKYISLTGVNAGKPKLYFGGPLTEWTACDQAGSCFSISNVSAWSQLWQAISSISQTRQYDMPFGTDLKIN